jgi:hypothetical protein
VPVVGEPYVSARSLAEYRAMFGLTEADLAGGRILDCPAGAASFGAEARAASAGAEGASIVGVDPAHAMPTGALLARAADDALRASQHSCANADRYRWDGWFRSHQALLAARQEAGRRFAADFRSAGPRRGRRYLAGALPHLPFAAGSFRLTLSSHLLFVYADRLDFDFHLAAVVELVRVTEPGGEVRLFPLLDPDAVRYPDLDRLRAQLERRRIATELRRVDYVVQVGGGELLVAGASAG